MASFDIDPDYIRKMADLLTETGLAELEIEDQGRRIRLCRGQPAALYPIPAAHPAPAAPAPAELPQDPALPPGDVITSPMVGTAYLAPEPGAAPFVKAGDQVTQGQTLMIVEAMKVMNPIKADRAGVVRQVLVTDAQPVEFGEPLMVVA